MTKPTPIIEGAVFDLAAIDRQLRSEDAYRRDGHTARTLVREPALRIVLVVMQAGARIAEHRAQEITSIQALTGHVRLALIDPTGGFAPRPAGGAGRVPTPHLAALDRSLELAAGRVLVIPPDLRHHVEAVADSGLLLTLAWCERR
jgi:quercetin dioxygenase-like cupin family protein